MNVNATAQMRTSGQIKDFTLHREPQVEPLKAQQLDLFKLLDKMTPQQVIEHIIKLYGDELNAANSEIARLRNENDELFRIKQKVVIANRELKLRLAEMVEAHKVRAEDTPA